MNDKTPPPAPAPDGADPSMEDILASIRRILNEDETPAAAHGTEPPLDDVLVLDRSMMVSPPEADGENAAQAAEPEPETETPPQPVEPVALPTEASTPSAQPNTGEPPLSISDLVAPEAAAAAASSVGSLVRTLAAGRATQVYAGGPTLEDMVRAELRPLLKEWLDANLPPVVERLVRAEIERVVGRAVP